MQEAVLRVLEDDPTARSLRALHLDPAARVVDVAADAAHFSTDLERAVVDVPVGFADLLAGHVVRRPGAGQLLDVLEQLHLIAQVGLFERNPELLDAHQVLEAHLSAVVGHRPVRRPPLHGQGRFHHVRCDGDLHGIGEDGGVELLSEAELALGLAFFPRHQDVAGEHLLGRYRDVRQHGEEVPLAALLPHRLLLRGVRGQDAVPDWVLVDLLDRGPAIEDVLERSQLRRGELQRPERLREQLRGVRRLVLRPRLHARRNALHDWLALHFGLALHFVRHGTRDRPIAD